jgi:hypothetical protein
MSDNGDNYGKFFTNASGEIFAAVKHNKTIKKGGVYAEAQQ